MIAKNIITEEIIKDLDPSDSSDLYYSLDKREWKFIDEFSQEAGFPAKPITNLIINDYQENIYSLKDLTNVYINTSGNLFTGPGGF